MEEQNWRWPPYQHSAGSGITPSWQMPLLFNPLGRRARKPRSDPCEEAPASNQHSCAHVTKMAAGIGKTWEVPCKQTDTALGIHLTPVPNSLLFHSKGEARGIRSQSHRAKPGQPRTCRRPLFNDGSGRMLHGPPCWRMSRLWFGRSPCRHLKMPLTPK